MAGPRCKAILNGIVQGLIKALETILTNDQMSGSLGSLRDDWLQRLANCDLAVYSGDSSLLPDGGLCQIVLEMENAGLVTDEVWLVLRHPKTE